MMKTNINLLDLDNDILNIIGEKVKKDNLNRELKKNGQILNGKHIRFNEFEYRIPHSIITDGKGNYIKIRILYRKIL